MSHAALLILGVLLMVGSTMLNTPRGIRNNNPGNLRITSNAWKGKLPPELNTDGAFEQFSSPELGIRALYIDLRSKINRGLNTITKIMSVYAPPNENNTRAYIEYIENVSGINRDYILSENHIPAIIPPIIKMENGTQPYTDTQFKVAYSLV